MDEIFIISNSPELGKVVETQNLVHINNDAIYVLSEDNNEHKIVLGPRLTDSLVLSYSPLTTAFSAYLQYPPRNIFNIGPGSGVLLDRIRVYGTSNIVEIPDKNLINSPVTNDTAAQNCNILSRSLIDNNVNIMSNLTVDVPTEKSRILLSHGRSDLGSNYGMEVSCGGNGEFMQVNGYGNLSQISFGLSGTGPTITDGNKIPIYPASPTQVFTITGTKYITSITHTQSDYDVIRRSESNMTPQLALNNTQATLKNFVSDAGTGGAYNNVTGIYTVNDPGIFSVSGFVFFNNNAAGSFAQVHIYLNGGELYVQRENLNPIGNNKITISYVRNFGLGNTIEIRASSDSINFDLTAACSMDIMRLL